MTPPEPLNATHDTAQFACGEASLDAWLKQRALKSARDGASKTYVVAEAGIVVAYYALAVGAVTHAISAGKVKRNMPDPIPVMIIGRLAVDARYRGRGIARALVRDALIRTLNVAEIAGVRAMLVHALSDDAAQFWRTVGFEPSPVDDRTLMVVLKDVAAGMT